MIHCLSRPPRVVHLHKELPEHFIHALCKLHQALGGPYFDTFASHLDIISQEHAKMSFSNYDRWLNDFEYDTDASPPRRSSPPSSRRDRAGSLPSRSSRPVVGDDGWEAIPEDLFKPENWGLPPSFPAPHPETQEIVTNPGMMTSRFDTRRGEVVQFYPDHDPDLINTAQLDGLPYQIGRASCRERVF